MAHIDLLELPYFQGISVPDLVALVDTMRPTQFEADQIIVREHERIPLYIATSGRLVVTKQANPEQEPATLAELEGPTIFGEIELFCQLPAITTIRSLTPVSAFILTRETFDRLYARRDQAIMQFVFNVARVACHRLAIADEIMARCLDRNDITSVRAAILKRMTDDGNLTTTTGAFRIPRNAKP